MGFLNSIFGSKKEKEETAVKISDRNDPKAIYEAFSAIGVTHEGCVKLSNEAVKPDDASLYLNYRDGIFPQTDVAEKAINIICPLLFGKNVNLTMEGFMADDTKVLLKDANFNLEKLAIKDCSFGKKDWDKITYFMMGEDIKKIIFQDISKISNPKTNQLETPFLKDLAFHALREDNNLNSLTIQNCQMTDEEFSELAPKMNDSRLRKLDISYNYARAQGITDIIEALPDSMESFHMKGTSMTRHNGPSPVLETLCNRIKTMPNLKVLDLSECYLETKDLDTLLPALPRSLETLNLKDNAFNSDGMQKMLEYLKQPGCILTTTNITDTQVYQPPAKLIQEIQKAETANKKAALREKAEKIARIKREKTGAERLNEVSGNDMNGKLLHTALQNGILEDTFKKMTGAGSFLTFEELGTKDETGKTFLQACIDMKKISELMRPELYNNAKVYQTVYDTLPKQEKANFDGQENRPNFVKMKNQIMSNAVKAVIASKKIQR